MPPETGIGPSRACGPGSAAPNWLRQFWAASRAAPRWLGPLLLLTLYRCLYYTTLLRPATYPDSSSYISFNFTEFLHLQFTSGRTPLYPLIIRLCVLVLPDSIQFHAVTALQGLVSLVSLVFLYKTCLLITGRHRPSVVVMMLYGLSQATIGWDMAILTESFSLSGTVFLAWLLVCYLTAPKLKTGLLALMLAFVLIFLRPTFLLHFGILAMFFALRWIFCKIERRQNALLLGGSVLLGGLVLAYAFIFSLHHGIVSLSDAMPRQQLVIAIDRRYYQKSPDAGFRAVVDTALAAHSGDTWTSVPEIMSQYPLGEISRLAQGAIRANSDRYMLDNAAALLLHNNEAFHAYEIRLAPEGTFASLFAQALRTPADALKLVNFALVYLAILIELVAIVVRWVQTKAPPWLHLGLAAFPAGIIVSTFLSTSNEYMRTCIGVLPFFYLWAALAFAWLTKPFAKNPAR